MAKQVNDGQWACEHPGCTYKGTKEGYVKNHEKLKHGMHGGSGLNKAGQKEGKTDGKNGGACCPDCKGQNFRLLSSSVPKEAKYISEGYKKVCLDCDEVI